MNFDDTIKRIAEKDLLDFGRIFSNTIELFKKVWVQGFITLLLTFICILPFYLLICIPLIAAGITDSEMLQQEEMPAHFVIGMILIIPIFLVSVMTISLALMAAFLRICKLKDMNEQGADDYFHYFKNGRLPKLFHLSLIYLGVTLLGMITCGLGLIYAIVPLSLVPSFLAFNKELSAMEIVKASIRLGNKNWFVIFGLIIVMGFIAELGIILCFVGIFFTAMLAKIPMFYMYKDGVGFSENEAFSIDD
jgi:hypothetical protein